MAATHEDDRKLFVGALPQEAKEDDIKEYFGTFGEIENINLKMDQMTGRSRGFAFIVFKEVSAVDAAMANDAHVVKGKKVTCKKAEAKQGKIFIGKLPAGETLSKEDIQAHFAQFGEVVEVTRPVDKTKDNEPKGFGFVTFAREHVAKDLVKQGETTIGDHTVEIKKVTPNLRVVCASQILLSTMTILCLPPGLHILMPRLCLSDSFVLYGRSCIK